MLSGPARGLAAYLAALLLAPGLVLGQIDQGSGAATPFKPEELEQLAALIALYLCEAGKKPAVIENGGPSFTGDAEDSSGSGSLATILSLAKSDA